MKIDCNVLKNRYENELKKYHEHYIAANIPNPKLLIVGCGLSEESMIYVRNKIKKCSKFGIEVELIDTIDFYLHGYKMFLYALYRCLNLC